LNGTLTDALFGVGANERMGLGFIGGANGHQPVDAVFFKEDVQRCQVMLHGGSFQPWKAVVDVLSACLAERSLPVKEG
jgi:hypothetical protein